jgi:predicted flap endonuclease-1-like 5' DNA nuclease
MNLNIFTNFCGYWWLAWLLPFIIGLILGWLIWGKWARRVRELEDDLAKARSRNNDLEKKLKACQSSREDLERELKDYKYQLSAAKAEVSSLRAKPTTTNSNIENTSTGIAAGLASQSTPPTAKKDKYAKVNEDNLQIIEGIGPKMEQVLKENGVANLKILANKSPNELRSILDKYGDKYKIIDPSDWTRQASLASNHKWEKLMNHQKADGSESKAEKMFIKMGIIKAFSQDDLKAIEGIGPKISELLMSNGIGTWKALADSSVSRLRTILDSQGSKYKLADPSTWPKQAQMAAEGDWDKLEEYQDFLNGGKDPS